MNDVINFLEENWSAFISHLEDTGEEDAEELAEEYMKKLKEVEF